MSLELWALIAQAATGLGAFSIAVVAFRQSTRSQRLHAIHVYVSHWRELNRLCLENSRASEARARLANRTVTENDSLNVLINIYINQALVAYHTWRHGGLSKQDLDKEFLGIWQILSNHIDEATAVLKLNRYPARFVKMFSTRMPKVERKH